MEERLWGLVLAGAEVDAAMISDVESSGSVSGLFSFA